MTWNLHDFLSHKNEVGKAARIFNENTKRSIKSALKTDSGIDEETKYKVAETEDKMMKDPESMSKKELEKLIQQVKKQMQTAAADLNFEMAAQLRDKMIELKKNLEEL